MKGHLVLTLGELHLIQAIIGKGAVFSGLEEFAMSEDRRPGAEERDGLIEKEILQRRGGRYEIDPTTGWLFSTLADVKAYVHGQVLWNNGQTARLNIYIFETEFLVVFAAGPEHLEFLWLPSIPLLIGCLCSFVHNHEAYREKAAAAQEMFSVNSINAVQKAAARAAEQSADPACCISFETAGTGYRWAGERYVLSVNRSGEVYYAEPREGSMDFHKVALAEALVPINKKILGEHLRMIRLADDYDQVEETKKQLEKE